MHPVSRLLLRNAPRFDTGGDLLIINPPADLPWRNLRLESSRLRLFTPDHGASQRLKGSGAPVDWGLLPGDNPAGANGVLLVLPREKPCLNMWLHWCAGQLAKAGTLWLAGENRAGAKSAASRLGNHFGQVAKVDSARHCTLFQAARPQVQSAFDLDAYFREWSCTAGGLNLRLASLPGVFAHGRTDPGTALLLSAVMDNGITGRVLDFGCGSGIIGVALKMLHPGLDLVMLDNSALALASTRRSLALNTAEADILASDGFSDVQGTFDGIVCNPPFHEGHVVKPGMSPGLLTPARNFLRPGGQLILVANRHLPYRRWLDEVFGAHAVLVSNRQFQVLRAVRG